MLSSFKSIFWVRINYLACNLPKEHSTEFLALQSKSLKQLSHWQNMYLILSTKWCQRVAWITNNVIWKRSHARQNTLVSFWQLRISQFFVDPKIGKHICVMLTSRSSALCIQKWTTIITNSSGIKWVKRFIIVIVLWICRWSHYLDMCTIQSTKCLHHSKLWFKISNLYFHFLLVTRKVETCL